jgi:metal transporter CNNM
MMQCAWDVYTPLRKIFAVPFDMELDRNSIADIYGEGYSRVPVFERLPVSTLLLPALFSLLGNFHSNVWHNLQAPNENRQYAMRGVLMTRQLIMIDWLDNRPVSSLPLYYPPCISPRTNLVDVLQLLQKGGSHIAFVCAGPDLANKAFEENRAIPIEAGFMGLVTLEDVLEAILQDHIYDEEDVSDRDLASALLTQWAAKVSKRCDGRLLLLCCVFLTPAVTPPCFRSCKGFTVSVSWLSTSNK